MQREIILGVALVIVGGALFLWPSGEEVTGTAPAHCDLVAPKVALLSSSDRDKLVHRWADRGTREIFAAALDVENHPGEAARVRALAPITDAASTTAARALLRELVPTLATGPAPTKAGSILFGELVNLDALGPPADVDAICLGVIVDARILDSARSGRGLSTQEEQRQLDEVNAAVRRGLQ